MKLDVMFGGGQLKIAILLAAPSRWEVFIPASKAIRPV